jgi:FAD/FMN-containing dehydrogenase
MPETSMKAEGFRDTGRFNRPLAKPAVLTPANLKELMRLCDPARNVALPLRPRGAGTSSTDCSASPQGTVICITGLDRIVHIDTYNHTVTAEAGVRIGQLVEALAEQGLELIGNPEQYERTLGGAVAAPCFGPAAGKQTGCFASHVTNLKLVTSDGKLLPVSAEQKHLLSAVRSSYGMLGIICEVTLDVRPISTFTATHRRIAIDDFASIADNLANSDVGMKCYVLPYRDNVYLDVRRYDDNAGNAYSTPWKIKDWGESTVLPQVFKSLSRVVPIPSVRYRIIDSISEATQGIVNTRLVRNGNHANIGSGHRKRRKAKRLLRSTWCFPATDFSLVLQAYRDFCRDVFERSGYRCDMPAVGVRVARDSSALLSPSFDEPLIALQSLSTQPDGWEDFVIDLAEFAEQWGGVPVFNDSRALRAEHAGQVYATRLEFFRKIRRQLDPKNRLLNPFLGQCFT